MERRSLVNYIGIAILLAGMATGEALYWHGLRSAQDDTAESPYDSRVYQEDVKRSVGVFGLMMDQGARALHEPKAMGIAVGLSAMALAAACFLFASQMPLNSAEPAGFKDRKPGVEPEALRRAIPPDPSKK
ncbi:MAG TPA: hypothetical protein VHY22_05430 [Chthoniobacteraceae bacterium]|jgi:hypothetical protein|nr:hypothetical protein [Chthoniobacteraceae bacterium]